MHAVVTPKTKGVPGVAWFIPARNTKTSEPMSRMPRDLTDCADRVKISAYVGWLLFGLHKARHLASESCKKLASFVSYYILVITCSWWSSQIHAGSSTWKWLIIIRCIGNWFYSVAMVMRREDGIPFWCIFHYRFYLHSNTTMEYKCKSCI